MKKYIICSFLCLCLCALCAGYYFSYDKAVKKQEEARLPEQEQELAEVAVQEGTVKSSAKLITEVYNTRTEDSERKVTTMPAVYLGMNREQVLEQLNEYMKNLSIADLEEGLVGYELLYYSSECLMIRKTYQPQEDFHKYYIKLSKGLITVFYSDRKTVYEYTDINISQLPSKLAIDVINGLEVKDEKELYDFLENYSS